MAKPIELNIANQTACLCPVCPVQDSDCIDGKKRAAWVETRKKVVGGILEEYAGHPETYDMSWEALKADPVGKKHQADRLRKEDMIELYCAIGKTDCRDLDTSEQCVCPDCAVWERHSLEASYFCQRGKAQEIERRAA